MSEKYRIFTLFVFTFILGANLVFAGVTGKITGKVIDKNTGEAMPGVNVVVKGTTLGASTDFDGYYTILNIPPGLYSLNVTSIGYTPVTVNGVKVNIDQTTPVNIQMVEEAIEIANITVIAERNTLKKDVSTSVAAVQPDEIQSLPVSSVAEVIGLQAGVEEGMVIRGGTSDQMLFQLDGVTMRDPRDNSPITMVALSSIQEVSIERGGFNAEYGQVRSGIVNIVGKEGSTTDYFGAFQFKYAPPQQKYFGMSVYDPNSMWNKPYLDNEVAWTGTENGTWDYYTQRQYPIFQGWNAVSQTLLSDNDPTNDLSPAAAQKVWEYQHRRRPVTNQPDYNIDASFGGPIPFVSQMLGNLRFFTSYISQREMFIIPLSRDDYREYNWNMKVNSDLSTGMKLMLSASTGKFNTVGVNYEENYLNNPTNFGIADNALAWGPTNYFRTPISIAQMLTDKRDSKIFNDSWYSAAEVKHLTLSGKFSNFITSSTFYEVGFEHVDRQYQTSPIAARDTNANFEIIPGVFVDQAPFGYDPRPSYGIMEDVNGDFFLGGHSAEMYDYSKVKSYKVKFDLTSQVNNENMVKFGVEYSTFDLNLDYGYNMPFFGDAMHVKESWKPYQVNAYVQDKIEMYGFIANLGLRLDVSNPNTNWVVVNPYDKSFFSGDYKEDGTYPTEKAKVDVAFSPRLGISHPITENSKLYFNYGHFKQIPAYQEIFRIGRGSSGAVSNYGNPNLVQSKTIAYELGYDHVLLDSYLLQIQAFYRDITDVQGFTFINSGSKGIGYNLANNNNYADTRGFEFTFKKSDGDWFRGFATFTYQLTTNGAFGSARIDDDPVQQRINDQNTQALYQTRPVAQPHARISLIFLTPADFGPKMGGVRPASDWSLNILGDWQAGQYWNYNPLGVRELVNVPNVQTSDYFNVDLRINKSFDFNYFNIMLFAEIKNLFDTKRLSGIGFYDGFDQTYYLQSLHLPKSTGYDNISGEDRIGDYRLNGADFQPIVPVPNISSITPQQATTTPQYIGAIFFDRSNDKYYNLVNGAWAEVESGRMQKILDDKAYIDMPNNTSFNFLNPRQIYFGINLSFKL